MEFDKNISQTTFKYQITDKILAVNPTVEVNAFLRLMTMPNKVTFDAS